MSTFADLGLSPALVETVDTLGYDTPTPIQQQAIPPLLEGLDVLGLAATGTGKTAAFSLPILHALGQAPDGDAPFGLVIVPTRELARQAARALRGYGKALRARVVEVYGGASIGQQIRELRRGCDVVVATPGRAVDLLNRRALDLGGVACLVLDEADEMLDMGFAEDLEELLKACPEERQTALFSATFPKHLQRIADASMRDPVRVEVERPEDEGPPQRELVFLVARHHKLAALERILELEQPEAALLFCRTRENVDELAMGLDKAGTRALALHGGLAQAERDRVMGHLRSGAAAIVVATDVAARGIDVSRLSHVVNVDLPDNPEVYVHRIGRVGRAGRTGVAITLAEPRQRRMLQQIQRLTGRMLPMCEVPTVEDLRQARREQLQELVQRVAAVEDLDPFKALVRDMCDDADLDDVAAAALFLVAESRGMLGEEPEIPAVAGGRRDQRDRGRRDDRERRPRRDHSMGPQEGYARIYVGLGRQAGVRPRDLVGAIAGETGLPGRAVGAIQVTSRFSLVEVPADVAEDVIQALRNTTIRGRRPFVRRDKHG